MALINGQSCLENIGLGHRPVLLMKNEYQKEEAYDVNHPNALATGDGRGRGTAHGGHTHSIPDCTKAEYIGEHFQSPIEAQIDSNIDSGPNQTGAGDCVDVNGRLGLAHSGRNALIGINIYDHINTYGAHSVNTELNVNDGQFVVGYNERTPILCAT